MICSAFELAIRGGGEVLELAASPPSQVCSRSLRLQQDRSLESVKALFFSLSSISGVKFQQVPMKCRSQASYVCLEISDDSHLMI